MSDQYVVYLTAGVIVALVAGSVFRRSFDPFAPIWLFLAGFTQIYVVQAISYRDWAIRVRGEDLVRDANLRALWALLWFLAIYHCGLGRWLARRLPSAPVRWSSAMVLGSSPILFAWGLVCSGFALHGGEISAEENLFRQFPIFMLVSGILLLVTGRQPDRPRPMLTAAGLGIVGMYVLLWMFNGKRSHSMIGVLTGVCAYYIPRGRRPSLPVLGVTGLACVLVVSIALGWRGRSDYEQSASGFVSFLTTEFSPDSMLVNLNIKNRAGADDMGSARESSKETEEYGGFLLMMATVPEGADYDYGSSYLRVVSTYIPRLLWPGKPYFGREQWIAAWKAGSEFPREDSFTGPAIGLLGAAQLNGGATATLIVVAVVALMARTAYDYYRLHAKAPWAQVWWALTYYNAWMLTANDDPFVWYYYNYGHTITPPLLAFFLANKFGGAGSGIAPATAPA